MKYTKRLLRVLAPLLAALALLWGLTACGAAEPAAEPAAAPTATAAASEQTEDEPADALPADESAADEATAPLPESESNESDAAESEATEQAALDPDGVYTTKDDVALYLYTYGELPANFITKKEARALGWPGGSLEPYAPGKCIGGDRFGNYEGTLPENRTYHECDINTLGADSRGAERLVYSTDGLIYYTGDHYETFTLLYGEE